METSPNEAVKNNVFGTLNLARCADEFAASTFVQISTDKAVNPCKTSETASGIVMKYRMMSLCVTVTGPPSLICCSNFYCFFTILPPVL